MLRADAITRHLGGRLILDAVSLSVDDGDRVGVVGPNGIGKSTLLRLLAGVDDPDGGRIERAPVSLTVGYLPQEPETRPGETLRAYLERRTGIAAAEAEMDRLAAAMADDPSDAGAYTDALERFLALGGQDLEARTGQVLGDLGLPADRLDVEMGALSGGQAARAALAAILLARFDVFLLDEPTNNLDFDGLARLERFVGAVRGAVVTVSHDRAFLDRCVTRILEIQEEHHTGVEYAGGYSAFVAARGLAREQGYEAHAKFVAERTRLRERHQTQVTWAEKGVARAKKRPKDNDRAARGTRIDRTEKQAAKVQATERRLARLEAEAVAKPWEGWELRLAVTAASRSGDVVARLEGAVAERGSFRLGPVDLEIGWAERVAFVGPNGSGKTTLLGALLGQIPLAAGRRYLGPSVVVGEMDQARAAFADDAVVIDAFMERTGLALPEARSLLAKLGLRGRLATGAAAGLSPGERSRAILATLMAQGANCLVLDEPTNHLDLEAIDQLEQALADYTGTLLLVSHDRRFLERVGITRTVELAS